MTMSNNVYFLKFTNFQVSQGPVGTLIIIERVVKIVTQGQVSKLHHLIQLSTFFLNTFNNWSE